MWEGRSREAPPYPDSWPVFPGLGAISPRTESFLNTLAALSTDRPLALFSTKLSRSLFNRGLLVNNLVRFGGRETNP